MGQGSAKVKSQQVETAILFWLQLIMQKRVGGYRWYIQRCIQSLCILPSTWSDCLLINHNQSAKAEARLQGGLESTSPTAVNIFPQRVKINVNLKAEITSLGGFEGG